MSLYTKATVLRIFEGIVILLLTILIYVFRTMFSPSSGFKEAQSDRVKIQDVERDAFQ